MLYHVVGEFIEENTAGKPPAEVAGFIERVIHPSLEALEKLMQEKKFTGGLYAGVRGGAFIVDASSHEEVSKILRGLPFWGVLKWQVTPLQSPRSAIEHDRPRLQEMKAQR